MPAVGIRLELRRQLKQDRARFGAEQRQAVFEQFEAVDRIVRQPLPVGDEFRCLPGEHEISCPVSSRQLFTASGVGVR